MKVVLDACKRAQAISKDFNDEYHLHHPKRWDEYTEYQYQSVPVLASVFCIVIVRVVIRRRWKIILMTRK